MNLTTQVIVLNGGSSSGKTTIARRLQEALPRPWIRMGVDDLVEALPPSLLDAASAPHQGVEYDLEVDTSHAHAEECARRIAGAVA